MKLYEFHDRTLMPRDWEDAQWLAVWCDDNIEAVDFYRRHYREQVGQRIDREDIGVRLCDVAAAPERAGTHAECRPAVLRLIGWREPGETACDTCGLSACGLKDHAACPECYQCPACGCGCADEPAIVEEVPHA